MVVKGFWELFRESVVVQGLMAIVSIGAIVYLAVTGRTIPDVLVGIVMAIVGFYFGSKRRLED